ncbi:MAG: hypothetical protein ACPLX8_00070 [Nanopusillaceae archaeon]
MEKLKLSFQDFFGAVTIYSIARDYTYNVKLNIARLIRNRMNERFFSDGSVIGTVLYPYQFNCWSNNEERPELIKSFVEGLSNMNESVLLSIKAWNESKENKGNDLILGYKNQENDDICDTGKDKKIIVETIPPFIFFK